MIRVVAMVEGSRLQAAGFRMLLRQVSSNISVLAVVRGFEELGHAVNGRAPDIAVLDVRSLDPALIQVVRRLRETRPTLKIMLVVDAIDASGAREVMRLGVSGLFSSDADLHGLARALQVISAGDVVISSTASGPLFSEPAGPIPSLTAHELRILRLLAKGLRNEEIARQLAISTSTLKRNLRPILSKLHATDRASALFAATKAGLL